MRIFLFLFYFGAFPFINTVAQRKVKVLLLGTYHMGGNTPDAVKVSGENILSDKKQQEMKEVLDALQHFAPQQIMIEYSERSDSAVNRIYNDYRINNRLPAQKTILTSELFQLAMQLGKRLNMERLTPVDFQETEDTLSRIGNLNWQYRKALGDLFRTDVKTGDYGIPGMSEIRNRQVAFTRDSIPLLPIKEVLLKLNSDRWQQEAFYTGTLCFIDKNPANMGAELAEMTLFRHLHIFRNMVNHTLPSTEKILLIIGASHAGPLREWFRSHPNYEVISLGDIL